MGVDLKHKHVKSGKRTSQKSFNPYLALLVKVYRFLARRTGAKFNKVILRRLYMSRINRPSISIKKIAYYMSKDGNKDKIAVCVGTVTNDVRLLKIPAVKICALRFTEEARRRIVKAGGQVLTFDQLAMQTPKGKNTVLLQGNRTTREACKHFGPAPGVPKSHTKPYVISKGRKFEKARGRRKSRGYKV